MTELTNSPRWSEVAVIVRRNLEQWDNLPSINTNHKINIS